MTFAASVQQIFETTVCLKISIANEGAEQSFLCGVNSFDPHKTSQFLVKAAVIGFNLPSTLLLHQSEVEEVWNDHHSSSTCPKKKEM